MIPTLIVLAALCLLVAADTSNAPR